MKRIAALLAALSLAFICTLAAAENHSEYWLNSWADDLFKEAQQQPEPAEPPDLPLAGRLILAYVDANGKCNVYCKYGGPKVDPLPEDPDLEALLASEIVSNYRI